MNFSSLTKKVFCSKDQEFFDLLEKETIAYCTDCTKEGIISYKKKVEKMMPFEKWGLNMYLGDGDSLKFYSV